tara:strand:- start:99 stop:644 length:546 start_codon:yes stop_codon:yes gene_type:complete
MTKVIYTILILTGMFTNFLNTKILYDFTVKNDLSSWVVVDDVVMGGRSSGSLNLDPDGNGSYSGRVSLDNYGGFSSVRCRVKNIDLTGHKSIILRVFGDNKAYQLRIRSKYYDRHVYVKDFYAKDEWQNIDIPLNSMEAQYRGRKLNMNNFDNDSIVEFGILIGNKVDEEFSLLIDYIGIK